MKSRKTYLTGVMTLLLFMLVYYSSAHISVGYKKHINALFELVKEKGLSIKAEDLREKHSDVLKSNNKTKDGYATTLPELPPCANLSAVSTVSGCFLKGASQLAIVRFEVSWNASIVNPTSGDDTDAITVQIGDKTWVINPGKFPGGEVKAPYPVAFELPADGSTVTAQIFTGADFASSSCAIEITGLALPTGAGCGSGSDGGGGGGPTTEVTCGILIPLHKAGSGYGDSRA